MTEHVHDWIYLTSRNYRDEDRKEYVIEFYKCECGAGRRMYVPVEVQTE